MSAGVKGFFLSAFFCDGFSSKKRVLVEVVREKRWRESIEGGHIPLKPRRVRLRGREICAYFMIVQAERNPFVFLVGIPMAIGLYGIAVVQLLVG